MALHELVLAERAPETTRKNYAEEAAHSGTRYAELQKEPEKCSLKI